MVVSGHVQSEADLLLATGVSTTVLPDTLEYCSTKQGKVV